MELYQTKSTTSRTYRTSIRTFDVGFDGNKDTSCFMPGLIGSSYRQRTGQFSSVPLRLFRIFSAWMGLRDGSKC